MNAGFMTALFGEHILCSMIIILDFVEEKMVLLMTCFY